MSCTVDDLNDMTEAVSQASQSVLEDAVKAAEDDIARIKEEAGLLYKGEEFEVEYTISKIMSALSQEHIKHLNRLSFKIGRKHGKMVYEPSGFEIDGEVDGSGRYNIVGGSSLVVAKEVTVNMDQTVNLLDKYGVNMTLRRTNDPRSDLFKNVLSDGSDGSEGKSVYSASDLREMITRTSNIKRKREKVIEAGKEANEESIRLENKMKELGAELDDEIGKIKEYTEVESAMDSSYEDVVGFMEEINKNSSVKANEEHLNDIKDILKIFMKDNKKYIPEELRLFMGKAKNGNLGKFIPYKNKKTKAGVYINIDGSVSRQSDTEKSPAEKYAHEMLHAVLYYAIESKDPEIASQRRRLERMKKKVLEQISYKDLMVGSTKEDEKVAKATLAHIRGENSLHEFVSIGLTNEAMIKFLKGFDIKKDKEKRTTAWAIIKGAVSDILDAIMSKVRREPRNIKAHQLLVTLGSDIMKANNNAKRENHENIVQRLITDKIDKVNNYISNKFNEMEENAKKKEFPKLKKNATKLDKSIWVAKNLIRFYADSNTRPFYENVLNSIGGPFKHMGMFQSILRSLSKSDAYQELIENIALKSTGIDGERFNLSVHASQSIQRAFKGGKIDRKTSEALHDIVLETDMQSLDPAYKFNDIMDMLRDENKIDDEIKKREEKIDAIASKSIYKNKSNFYKTQAEGLGEFMVTNKAGSIQLLNADNIAREVGSNRVLETVNKELSNEINILASLHALKKSDIDKKIHVAETSKNDSDGIKVILDYHKSFVKETSKDLFNENTINMIKGYTSEIFDEDIAVEIAPVVQASAMAKKGFVLNQYLSKSDKDKSSEPMAMYVNMNHPVDNYIKQAVRTTGNKRRGTTLGDVYRSSGQYDDQTAKAQERIAISEIKEANKKALKEIYKGGSVEKDGLVPVFNSDGTIKTYRYMMSKENKRNILGQDTRIQIVMGAMFSNALDKVDSEAHNKIALKAIVDDVKDNYDMKKKTSKNHKEYIWLSNDLEDKDLAEKWKILPSTMRIELQGISDKMQKEAGFEHKKAGFPIRADMVRALFGERDASLKNITPAFAKRFVGVVEQMWMSIVKIAKVDIVIRTPAVWIGNMVSNLALSVQFGMGLRETLKLQIEGFNELKEYKKIESAIIDLKLQRKKRVNRGEPVVSINRKIKNAEEDLKRNGAHPLIEAGLFSSVIEDISADDRRANDKIARFIDKKTEGMPEIIKNGANYLYLTERTGLYQAMVTATQYGDFVARYAMLTAMNKKEEGIKSKSLRRELTQKEKNEINIKNTSLVKDAFINYNIADNNKIKWLNDMGLIMFTKFFVGIQKVIARGVRDKPMNIILALIGQGIFADIDDITDHSIITKNYSGMMHMPFDSDLLAHAITPSLFEMPSLFKEGITGIIKS